MQPLKIVISGNYYDCQIYRGRLYLWTFKGSLQVFDWEHIVQSQIIDKYDWLPITLGFIDGHYLYKPEANRIFNDADFRDLLSNRYEKATKYSIVLSFHDIENSLIGEQNVPSNLLPTDTEIYGNTLYYINETGLYKASAHRNRSEKYPVSSRPTKLWDCILLSLKANKYPQIALSGGCEGLFELNMISNNHPAKLIQVEDFSSIYKISDRHSSLANYSFLSLYNTSFIADSFMALFNWHIKDQAGKDAFYREYDFLLSDQEIFDNINQPKSISWGIEDKLYQTTSNGFNVIKFNNNAKEDRGEKRFTKLNSISFDNINGRVINGGSAYFGNIIECENALIVMQSDGDIFTIPEAVTRWRVYPRSLNYENHLHVILDDRIEIYSFNHDYFISQGDKKLGIEYTPTITSYRKKQNYSFDELSL